MLASLLAALLLALSAAHPHNATTTHRSHRRLGRHYTVDSTCYHEGSITASGAGVFVGEVANNFLPLGTRIVLDRPVFGRRDFQVLDRIGWGSELDVYGPSEGACDAYGRESLGFRVAT